MKLILILALCVVVYNQNCLAQGTEHTLDKIPNVAKHRAESLKLRPTIGIIVASDTHREESGVIASSLLDQAGFKVEKLDVVSNLDVKKSLESMLADDNIQAVLCIGGTGISPDDITIEAINDVIDKQLPGYGEYLRILTRERWVKHEEKLGLMFVDTRANAGVAGKKLVFAIPGSPDATELAVNKIIIPGLPTLYGQLLKKH